MTNSPTPPHHLSHHSTRLRFHSTLNRPIIIATVAVAFSEEIWPRDEQDAQTHDLVPEIEDNDKEKKAKEKQAIGGWKHSNSRSASPGCKDGHDNTPQGEDISGNKHINEGSLGGTQEEGSIPGGTSTVFEDRDE